LMEKTAVMHIPIVDENKKLIGLELLNAPSNKKRYENIVFLFAL